MLRSAVTTFYRSLARHPLYAALNLLGLSFGVAAFIVLSLFVHFETSYEQWVPNAGAIYELSTVHFDKGREVSRRFRSAGGAWNAIHREFPDQLGTRVAASYIIVGQGEQARDEEGQLVDPEVFRVFNIGWVAGTPATALQRSDAIVLSEAMARKYFGRTDIIGRRLILRDDLGPLVKKPYTPPPPRAYVVTGVLKNPPGNSALRFDFVRLLTPEREATEGYWDEWSVTQHHTYLYVDGPAALARLQSRLDHIVDTYGKSINSDTVFKGEPRHKHIGLGLVPLTAEHLADKKTATSVWVLGMVGLLALAVALINYVNLATARAGLRAREVAVRLALGATVAQIRAQFLCEAVLVSLISGLLGLSLVELSLPLINYFGGQSLRLDYGRDGAELLAIMSCVLLSGLLAGLYPAAVLSGFEPAQVLVSARSPNGGRVGQLIREALVILQFSVVTAFFIVVAGFAAQVRHMETSDLGFSRQGLLMTNSTISAFLTADQIEAVHQQWRALPNVVSVTTGAVPGRYFLSGTMNVTAADGARPAFNLRSLFIERDFFRTYGTDVLAGRALTDEDRPKAFQGPLGVYGDTIPVDVNMATVHAMGLASPQAAVGRTLTFLETRLRIIGVVADQRLVSPTLKMGPSAYFISDRSDDTNATVLRFEGVPQEVITARMAAVWRRLVPDLPLETHSGMEALDDYYVADRHSTHLFGIGAAIAGLIGAIGLYGMAAFATSNRALEIGLRKVAGASRERVAGLLVIQFLRPVLVACMIAVPVAWLSLSMWLTQFDDRVAMSPWLFVIGVGVSLVVAVATVAGLALSAASATPAKALRRD